MDLKEVVAILDGPAAAARISGIKRTSINYWLEKGAPDWRKVDVEKLIGLAKLKQEMPKGGA